MTRNEAREILMQIMYEVETAKSMDPESVTVLAQERLAGNHIQRGIDLLNSIVNNIESIDDKINKYSRSWKTSRMPKVDLAILRLAIGEMEFGNDIPAPVAINEAINLGKKYSTEQSSRFIHGVLGAIAKNNE